MNKMMPSALAQIVASSLKVHSIAGKLDDPVRLDLAMCMHARAKATLQFKLNIFKPYRVLELHVIDRQTQHTQGRIDNFNL